MNAGAIGRKGAEVGILVELPILAAWQVARAANGSGL